MIKEIPENIDQLKKDFILEYYHNEWNQKIQTLSNNYQQELKTLPASIQLQNFESFGITFTYNTERIEGSTLTQEDTKDLLIHGITPNKKSKIDTIETQRHYDLFIKLVSAKKLKIITTDIVLFWHGKIFEQTKIDESGSVKSYRVGIRGNDEIKFATVPQIKPKLKKLFEWINRHDGKITPVELACIAHYEFVTIHPFGLSMVSSNSTVIPSNTCARPIQSSYESGCSKNSVDASILPSEVIVIIQLDVSNYKNPDSLWIVTDPRLSH